MQTVSTEESERWKLGNADEKHFWLGLEPQDFLDHERGYRALAARIDAAILIADLRPDFRALRIGCAVEDTILYVQSGERFAVDPLANFFKATFERSRKPGVDYRQGVGEELPLGDDFFDVVILQNLLDHVVNYDGALTRARLPHHASPDAC